MATDAANTATEANQRAWNAQRFNAWISAFGSPEAEAARIVAEPERVLRRLSQYLGGVAGKRICNVQGSHGRIAVALARQGADVTVIDFSEENRRFALDLAAAAGVTIDYALCDIMEAGGLVKARDFDVLVLELGILHYHQDIEGFFHRDAQACERWWHSPPKRVSSDSEKAVLDRRTAGLFPDRPGGGRRAKPRRHRCKLGKVLVSLLDLGRHSDGGHQGRVHHSQAGRASG